MSTQRIDYVRQNIEKFASKKSLANKVDKTPIRLNSLKQRENDENKPVNGITKGSATKSSLVKNQLNRVKSKISPTSKINLINKIRKTNGVLTSKNHLSNQSNDTKQLKQTERRQSNEKQNERRQSNEKANKLEKQLSRANSNEQQTVSSVFSINDKKKISTEIDRQTIKASGLADKQTVQPIKLAQFEKATKTFSINLNEDLSKHRILIENDLLRFKYLNARCETKLRRQNQQVIEIVKSLVNLIEIKRENCLNLEQELAVKETLLFLMELSEQNLVLLKDVDLRKLKIYLNLVSNIIKSVLSSIKVSDIKNAKNINDLIEMTTAKLTSDLKMDNLQEFSDKLKQFNIINEEIFETINCIRNLKINLIDEINRRIELKNIY